MIYRHTYSIHTTLAEVREFHARSSSMAAITPPPVIVRIHQAPQSLTEGDEMVFTMWLLLLPIRWVARIEDVSPMGFVDRQLQGPFKEWVHRHTFTQQDKSLVKVIDEVQLTLSSNPFWWLVGAGMRLSLPLLFAYRGWKTRRMLEK